MSKGEDIMTSLRFAKMSGAGNDFIVLDNRKGEITLGDPDFIRRLCCRRMAVGADGVIVLLTSSHVDFAMKYFNADGSEAAMCGNGGRCLARFAVLAGAGEEGQELIFTTPSGVYHAQVAGSQVSLNLPTPKKFETDIKLQLKAGERTADFTDTGVPHLVFFSGDLETEDVEGLGREARWHERFKPAGTNVSFCRVVNEHCLELRTYERGIEGETLACGTGAAAAALLAARRSWVSSPVTIKTRGGAELEMSFTLLSNGFSEVQQKGEARLIYWGELSEEAVDFK